MPVCAPAGQSHSLVHGRGDRGLAGRATHHPGRAGLLLDAGHHDRPDVASRVPLGAAPDRGAGFTHEVLMVEYYAGSVTASPHRR
jgi:hypothetical protein